MRVRELLSHGASAAAKLPKWFLKARKPPQSQISRRPLPTAPQPPPPRPHPRLVPQQLGLAPSSYCSLEMDQSLRLHSD